MRIPIGRRFARLIGYCRHAWLLSRFSLGWRPEPITIVTGANASHGNSLLQLVRTLFRYEPLSRIIVFDLGLAPQQAEQLRTSFPKAELRQFDFSQWPCYFNINVNAGEYAWKPVIISDVMDECQKTVLWLDAGCVIFQPLALIRNAVQNAGLYSPHSSGLVGQWTHPSTSLYLSAKQHILEAQLRWWSRCCGLCESGGAGDHS